MRITVEMSKDEFLSWNNFLEYKKNLISGIIEIEDTYNALVNWFMDLDNTIDVPKTHYSTFENILLKDFRNRINKLKEGSENDNTTT